MKSDQTFEERSRRLREEEELRNAAYAAAKAEAAVEAKRENALELMRVKSRNLQRPKYAVIKTWGDWFDEKIVLYMPDQINDTIDIMSMPRWANITLFAVFLFFSVCIFVYFAYAGIDGALQLKFISIAGNSSIQLCHEVPAIVNGQFSADKYGVWSTDGEYRSNAAIYSVNFAATNVTTDRYSEIMDGFGLRMKELGTRMDNADLAWILMAWTTVTYVDKESGIRLTTMASAETVFGNSFPFFTTTISYYGECDPVDGTNTPLLRPIASLTEDNTQLRVSYDMGSYIDYHNLGIVGSDAFDDVNDDGNVKIFREGFSPCMDQFSPEDSFGYEPYEYEASSSQDTTMDLTLDIRSMLLATSVNFGIVSLDDLMVVREETRSMLEDYFTNETMPPFRFYTDPYANAEKRAVEPIACVPSGSAYPAGNITQVPFCLVFSQYNFFYPTFWSKSSYDTSGNSYCECSGYAGYNAVQKDFCNGMYIELLAVYDKEGIFAKMDEYEAQIASLGVSNVSWHVFELGAKYSWYMHANNMTGDQDIRAEMQEVLKDEFGDNEQFEVLCPKDREACGALVVAFEPLIDVSPLTPLSMELGDLSSTTYTDQYGWSDKKQVTCMNTIYEDTIFRNMSTSSPVALVESFYECSYTWNQAFVQSIGNASASASLYTFFIMYVVIYAIVYLVQYLGGGEIENPRVKDFHDSKGEDKDKEIVHTALKRIITLGKADVLDPAFVELFKEDYDGDEDLTKASLSAANAVAMKRGSLDSQASRGSRGSGGTKGTKGAKAAKEDDRLAAVSEESEV